MLVRKTYVRVGHKKLRPVKTVLYLRDLSYHHQLLHLDQLLLTAIPKHVKFLACSQTNRRFYKIVADDQFRLHEVLGKVESCVNQICSSSTFVVQCCHSHYLEKLIAGYITSKVQQRFTQLVSQQLRCIQSVCYSTFSQCRSCL